MKKLVVIPTKNECTLFLKKCVELGHVYVEVEYGKLICYELTQLQVVVALGGLGKAQFGVQTQYLIDRIKDLDSALCIGASGCLNSNYVAGDVVVGTKTVEHDIQKHSRNMMPEFASDALLIDIFQFLTTKKRSYSVHFGPIASGDEDVMSTKRKAEVRERTGADVVAWEGAGGARACHFSDVPFVEIRGITDFADHQAEGDFFKHLEGVMGNLAELVVDFVHKERNG
ncbi:5'-methylthioadenosine/S-adenosylhomocysteine nucleosidase [Leucothrix arctica]|uniref:Acyltransferase n=1 Tax=Leucothrix arctica TaxID=1481894 RepID=A0A317CJZ2_9GAMM|nr:5'-methylthioadenosine/S-adenosylhomocysteine nucleosidase [Leucothrix arctica]PWQ97763.1 acyltransferase [Leucothrix arctica]